MSPSRFVYAVETAAMRGDGQDRARVFALDDGLVIALADGAGGTARGAEAAQAIVNAVGAVRSGRHDWGALLAELDEIARCAHRGQSTAVVVSIVDGVLNGASVGDSGAWLVRAPDAIELTEGQQRKPLVGSGCLPHRLGPLPLAGGTLLVASDGLLPYARFADIVRLAAGPVLSTAARALVDLVRLPGGALQDDVSVVLCRAVC